LYFRNTGKALVVNATNFDTIAGITGEPNSDNWIGHEIELLATTTMMAGKETPCVRVRAPGKASKAVSPSRAVEPKAGESDSTDSENPDSEIPF